jgi:hypothetical protein
VKSNCSLLLYQYIDVPAANKFFSFNLELKSSAFSLGNPKSLITSFSSDWMSSCGLRLSVWHWYSSTSPPEPELLVEASSNISVGWGTVPLGHEQQGVKLKEISGTR